MRMHSYNNSVGMSMKSLPMAARAAVREIMQERKLSEADLVVRETAGGGSFTVEMLNLFIKCLCDEDDDDTMSLYFNNEIVFYGEISSMHNIPVTSVPKCIKVDGGKAPFVILDNLLSHGYRALDAKEPLSLECVRLVLRQLGKLHAFSFALKEQRPDEFNGAVNKLQETVFRPDMRWTCGKLFVHAIHDALKLAKQSLPANSVYVEKFALFTFNVFDTMCDLAGADNEDGEFHVITHGDLWADNILCKFDNETGFPQDASFVDFQGCRYASPVHDLMFVLLLAVDKSTRDEFRDELLQLYHNSLCAHLQTFALDPIRLFPYSALQRQLLKHTRFALAIGLAGLPLHTSDTISIDRKNLTLLEFLQQIGEKKSTKCKHKMLEILMDVVDSGYLETN